LSLKSRRAEIAQGQVSAKEEELEYRKKLENRLTRMEKALEKLREHVLVGSLVSNGK
jgi:hypothetical protein